MNITSKSKYAVRAIIHLAQAQGSTIRREDLAHAQGGISSEYLEKILLRLREKRIVEAKSGPGGGYRLVRHPSELTAWDVISVVEDSPEPVSCLDPTPNACVEECEARILWKKVWEAAANEMKRISIASLIAEGESLKQSQEAAGQSETIPCR